MACGQKYYKSTEHTEGTDHRNLDGIYTDFIELLRKKSLGEIFFKMLLRKKYCGFAVYLQTKSLTKIFDQNAQQYVALLEGFNGDRLTARIFGAARVE